MATEGKLSGVNSEDDFTEEFNAREDAEMEETFLHFNNIYSQQQQHLPNSGISQQKSDSQQRTPQDMKSILVNEMQEYQCIWNNRVKGYKDLNKKAQAWKELSLKTRVNGEKLKIEWSKLRENYSKCISRRERMTRSGSSQKKLPTCSFFEELSYLRDSVAPRSTQSNISFSFGEEKRDLFQPVSESSLNSASSNLSKQLPLSPVSDKSANATSIASSTTTIQRNTSCQKNRKNKQQQEQLQTGIDALILKALAEPNPEQNKSNLRDTDKEDPDRLFCLSLVGQLQELPKRINQFVKFKIQETLYKAIDEQP